MNIHPVTLPNTSQGDLVFMEILGRKILVVNSFQAVDDLFEKRSANYSDRNELPMINDLWVPMTLHIS